MENCKRINKYLKGLYGLTLDGRSKFRLVWSEDVLEKRLGYFEDYTPSGILVRKVKEVREVKKYSYITDRFILEAYMPEQRTSPEIMAGDDYEPLFVFQDRGGNFLSPQDWACDYVISRYLLAVSGEIPHKNDSILAKEHEEEIDKEAEKFVSYLEADEEGLSDKFRYGEAVALPGKELN